MLSFGFNQGNLHNTYDIRWNFSSQEGQVHGLLGFRISEGLFNIALGRSYWKKTFVGCTMEFLEFSKCI